MAGIFANNFVFAITLAIVHLIDGYVKIIIPLTKLKLKYIILNSLCSFGY